MNGLATQSANDINDTIDRDALDSEFQALKSELGDIGNLKFNGKNIFGGAALNIQVGPEAANTMTINSIAAPATTVADIKSFANANGAITTLQNDINTISTRRAELGAVQNRLEHKINNLDVNAENLQAAESRIRDVDMAKEMTTYSKNNILSQAATAMLAQANNAPQQVLQLLR